MKKPATKQEFDAELAAADASGKAVVVDFTATWCGPCQRIGPIFEALAQEFPHVIFLKVDVDENQETASALGVQAMPTFKAFVAKKEVGSVRGADEAALRVLIETHQGSKWGAAGEGHTLGGGGGSGEATAGMSEREKRLAALEKRGL